MIGSSECRGELRHCRVAEEIDERDRPLEPFFELMAHRDDLEGVSTVIEERPVPLNLVDAQHPTPHIRYDVAHVLH